MDKSWAVGSNESPITRGRRKAAEENASPNAPRSSKSYSKRIVSPAHRFSCLQTSVIFQHLTLRMISHMFLIFRGSGKRDLVRFLTAVRSPANFWCKR
ncbi:hypothetical protein L5515_013482 [Caenorhabditis briggsae]|uniref:Uncharacterized protein n=1 Tax=Caenorhabditis briggsae TaxID=6238 RepID=A0AAE9EAR1_CAEBR|nr:hypothetical protein L5515_013482 [Caenorhabditis briggsae]